MGTIDEELNDYVRNNFESLNSMLPNYIYESMLKDKKNNEDIFTYQISAFIFNNKYISKNNLPITKEKIIKAQIPNNTLSIEKISEKVYTAYLPFFSFGKQYLSRALYFIENYKQEDLIFAKLLYSVGTFYQFLDEEDNQYLSLFKRALKIQRKFLDDNHIDIAETCFRLGIYYLRHTISDNRGICLLEKAMKTKEGLFGIKNKDVSTIREFIDETPSFHNEKYFFLNSKKSSLSFKIERLELMNFKQFNSFEMNFSKQINIIIGQNATGKTTLLQAITLALLRKDSPDELTSYRSFLQKGNRDSNYSIIKVFFDGYEKNIKLFRDKREIDDDYFVPFLLSYSSNLFTEYYRDAKFVVRDMLEAKLYESFANYIFQDFVEELVNPLRVLEVLEMSKRKNSKEIQKIFLETINIFLEDYTIDSNIDGEFFFIKKNENIPLYLEELSEGYRGNVLLITDMLIKILGVGWTPSTIEGIVLIDEFDKHLHPKWQSKLVNQLTKTFPKIQFIMTTHNPMSILDRNPDEITILKEIDGDIVAVKAGGTKNIDISGVLLEYFGVNTVIGKSLEKKLDEFTTLNIKENLTEEETTKLEKLREELSKTVAVNFINDYKYFEYLKEKENSTPKTKDVYSAIDDLGDIL